MRVFVAALALLASSSVFAEYTIFWTQWPYSLGTAEFPNDPSRIAFGMSREAVCGARSDKEIEGNLSPNPPSNPTIYHGMVSATTCGFRWLNISGCGQPGCVIETPTFTPALVTCSQTVGWPANWARPPMCPLDCPDVDKIDGECPPSNGRNAGEPDDGDCEPCVANPINPATGNKFQAEIDYPAQADGQLGFVRFYNSGVPAVNVALGGFWTHSFNSSLSANGAGTQAVYTRSNGRRYTFTLQAGTWVSPADIADVLTELKDEQNRRTGWRLRRAASEDVEVYDAGGRLTAIERRSGLTLTLVYTDGTNGSSSGNGGFVLDAAGNPTTTVLPKSLLLRAVDQFGKRLSFGYDTYLRIVKMTDPAGGVFLYTYGPMSGVSNLLSVTYPDSRQRVYAYNESANTSGTNKPNALTGITDEKGFRFATYKYNSVGRAIESVHHTGTGDADRHQLSYTTSASQTAVTDPLGTVRTYGFQVVLGAIKKNALDLPAPGVRSASNTYDANGNAATRVDWNGNRTNYTYDLARNLETQRVEGLTAAGATTPQTRTISTQWDTNFRLPTVIAEPLRITTMVYDATGATCGAKGALCSKSIQVTTDADGSQGFAATPSGSPRAWAYTYNANGSVLSINGPRTDVADTTTYAYYANNASCPTTGGGDATGCRGQVSSVTNAAGHATSINAYNAHGQPLTIVDPNGLTTAMVYDPRRRLTSRTVGTEVTGYEYDFAGQLTKVTLPDTTFLSYTYDGAHRLTGMQDNLGNSVTYTLDAMGNRTAEQVKDQANALVQTRSRVYNSLNRLFQELGAVGQVTEYGYDTQGNVLTVKVVDPVNGDRITTNQYDPLNRVKQVTAPAPVSAVTQYAYNGLDALTQVTDPRSLVTGYTINGLGNLTQQSSPDTGSTVSTYDDAGNLLTQTDAKSQLTTYAYDALNRVTLITFHDGSKQTYAYDLGANGIGRLSSITETNPSNVQTSLIVYAYDQHGRVLSETRTVGGVAHVLGYSYDSFGRLSGLTYPSTRTVTYGFDSLGRVNQVSTTANSQTQVIVQNVQYHPFGGVKSYTLGSGRIYSRSIDLDGRISAYTLNGANVAIAYDAANRITGIGANTYSYDNLDRLTSAVLSSSNFGYSYDGVGNRLTKVTGASTENYTYSPTSNRIATVGTRSFIFDANGSTTDDALNTYVYDTRGRMVSATSVAGTTSYQLNALGQRIRKTNSSADTIFHYDTRGRLIAETDPSGAVKREIFYLGDIPVGVFQ